MSKQHYIIYRTILPVLFYLVAFGATAQENGINNQVVSYKKGQLNSGFVFDVSNDREELRTNETRNYEEQTILNARYRFENKYWNLLDFKQEQWNASFEVGPFGGFGEWIDSSGVANSKGDQYSYGVRTAASVGYQNRFYYDPKNYTLIDVNAWGRYDVFKQNSDGSSMDTLGVVTLFDDSDIMGRLRYGFNVSAGWGIGRLSPMNHLMQAHYILEKYYPGRIFSDLEIARLAQVIAEVKHKRNVQNGHDSESEVAAIKQFLKSEMFLALPETIQDEWQLGEFEPRYEGQRFEFGPFFQYYNQEPDFVYGGYLQYENSKYRNLNWNRNISANLSYNRYKKQDWVTAELNIGWSYYSNLRNQFDFGVRYNPGIETNGFEDVGSLSHNFIPYVAWFTQLNSKSRMKMNFAWRIADGEKFVIPGPEFSLAIYRSRY